MSVGLQVKGRYSRLCLNIRMSRGDPYYKRDTGTFQRRKKSYGVPLYGIWRDNKLSGDLYGSEVDFL